MGRENSEGRKGKRVIRDEDFIAHFTEVAERKGMEIKDSEMGLYMMNLPNQVGLALEARTEEVRLPKGMFYEIQRTRSNSLKPLSLCLRWGIVTEAPDLSLIDEVRLTPARCLALGDSVWYIALGRKSDYEDTAVTSWGCWIDPDSRNVTCLFGDDSAKNFQRELVKELGVNLSDNLDSVIEKVVGFYEKLKGGPAGI